MKWVPLIAGGAVALLFLVFILGQVGGDRVQAPPDAASTSGPRQAASDATPPPAPQPAPPGAARAAVGPASTDEVLAQTLRAVPEPEPVKRNATVDRRLPYFEGVMARHYRGLPLARRQDGLNRRIRDFNRWLADSQKPLVAEQAEITRANVGLDKVKAEIAALDKGLAKAAVGAVSRRKAAARNAKVKLYNGRAKALRTRQAGLRQRVDQFHAETNQRRQALDKEQRDLNQTIEAGNSWARGRQDLRFFSELNQHYAELRAHKSPGPEAEAKVRKLRALRRELAQHTMASEAATKSGMIIVPGLLCGEEPCHFLVDTGANSVTVTPEMVKALGLTDRIGKEIEITLAGGIRIKAREITLPRLAVFGKEARNVEGVVLEANQVGVDGLLGHSFLDRFDYQIDRTKDPKLTLRPAKGSAQP